MHLTIESSLVCLVGGPQYDVHAQATMFAQSREESWAQFNLLNSPIFLGDSTSARPQFEIRPSRTQWVTRN
jgi:hypothetical protein